VRIVKGMIPARRVACVFVLLAVVCAGSLAAEVRWISGDTGCPEEWSIIPSSPTCRDQIRFCGPTGVHSNACMGAAAGGGFPTIVVDETSHTVELWFKPPGPSACPAVYDPVCGLEGEFGRLEAGDWTFFSDSPITKFSIPFSVAPPETLCVTGMVPAPGSILAETPTEIVVTFSDDVLSSSVTSNTFTLERINGYKIDAASIECLPGSRQATFEVSGNSLPRAVYRVTLTGDIHAINDRDAAILALEISEELLPPPPLYRRLYNDLAAIRKAYPVTTSVKHTADWRVGELIVRLTPEAWEQFKNGNYHGLDELNAQYGPAKIVPSHASYRLLLKFSKPYNPELLAPIYSSADGVEHAYPNSLFFIGIPDRIEVSDSTYKLRKTWDEFDQHWWLFSVIEGEVTLLDQGGSPLPDWIVPLCICDSQGEALDGEFGGVFPSGDGVPGGDFVATFRIGEGPRKTYWMLY
jgi:hypothetical protein